MTEDEKNTSKNVDNEILEILSKDCRISNRELGRKLGRSPLTIKNHIKELEKSGKIKGYGVQIDYEKLGYDIIALIEVTISKGKMLEVEKNIAQNPHIFAVYDLTGEYDAIIITRFKTRKELSELVKEINSYEYVIRTNTHLILNVIKEGANFANLLKFQ